MFTPVGVGVDVVVVVLVVVLVRVVVLAVVWFNSVLVVNERAGGVVVVVVVVLASNVVLVNSVDEELVLVSKVDGLVVEDVKFALAEDVVNSETSVDDVCSVFELLRLVELVVDTYGVVKAKEVVVRLGMLEVVVVLKLDLVVVVVVVCEVVRLSCLVVEVTMKGRDSDVKDVDVVAGVE
jgi:hypothetical protein